MSDLGQAYTLGPEIRGPKVSFLLSFFPFPLSLSPFLIFIFQALNHLGGPFINKKRVDEQACRRINGTLQSATEKKRTPLRVTTCTPLAPSATLLEVPSGRPRLCHL